MQTVQPCSFQMSCYPPLRIGLMLFFCAFFLFFTDTYAGSHDNIANAEVRGELDPKVAEGFEQSIERIESNLQSLRSLKEAETKGSGLQQEMISTRLESIWAITLEEVTRVAQELVEKKEAGFDVSAFEDVVVDYLRRLPASIEEASRPVDPVSGFPDSSLSVIELAALDEKIFDQATRHDDGSWALRRGIDAARRLGLDVSAQEVYLERRITDYVANASVFLDLSMDAVTRLKAAASVLPADVDLQAKVMLAEKRVQRTAAVIENNLVLFDYLGLDTSFYTQQLVTSTGKVSADVLDASLISALFADWGGALIDTIRLKGPALLFQALLFIAILFIFLKLAKLARTLVDKAFATNKVDVSALLRRMVTASVYNGIIIVGLLMALSQLGISLGPLLTGLGIAGFIIGFALQDSLANFASGILILIYRPYDVGDMVDVAGAFGTVERMSLVNTTILTLDNQTLIVPNNKIWCDVIKNLTYQNIRRVDMEFGVSYDQDLDQAEKVLHEVVQADERVLKDPELNVRVHTLGDSSVNFIVRPWVKTDDYWDVYWDLTKQVKQRFDAEGISIPFPQRDVHLFAGDMAANGLLDKPSEGGSSGPG